MADIEVDNNITNGNGDDHGVLRKKSIPTEILKKEFMDTPVESDSSEDEAVPERKFDDDLTPASLPKKRTFDTSLDDDDNVKYTANGNSSDRELKKLKRVIEELEDELADVEDEKKDLRRKLTSTEEQLSRAELSLTEREDECAALKRDIDRWRARVDEESKRRTALESQMKSREEKWAAVESNASEVTYLEGKLVEARVEIKKLSDELAKARDERDKMAESVKETGRDGTEISRKLQREIEALKLRHETELTLLRQELDEQHDLAQKSIDQLRNKFKAQLAAATAQSEESRGDEAEFRRVKRKLDRTVHELTEKLETERLERSKDLRNIESLTRLNKTLREKLDKLTLDKDTLDEAKFSLESEVKDLRTKLEIAEKQRQHFQEQAQALRYESNDHVSTRHSSKSERVEEPHVEYVATTTVDEQ